jgi:hypothetical protein
MCTYKVLSPCSKCSADREVVIPCPDNVRGDTLCTQMSEHKGEAPEGLGELCELHYYEAHEHMNNMQHMRGVAGLLAVVGSVATCVFMFQGSNLAAVLAGSAATIQGITTTIATSKIRSTQHRITGS